MGKGGKQNIMKDINRRNFLKAAACVAGGTLVANSFIANASAISFNTRKVKISGHIWVYASKFPPNWDSTPVIEQAFSDFQYAGLDGVELMEVNLRHSDSVSNLQALVEKYHVPVTGASYGAALWDSTKRGEILDDAEIVISRLSQLNGETFGVSVGDAGRIKTAQELDSQADVLVQLIKLCNKYNIMLNLHNHTYEVANGMHDLKGTLARIPDIKLGPDLNWLVRGGIDPVQFIQTYGRQMVYMHLRDQTSDGKWTEAVGTGSMAFKAIAKALNEQNYSGRAAVELAFDFPPVHPLKDDWKQSLQYVKGTFGWS
jgi:sugar phosphate isomerase/epimerase